MGDVFRSLRSGTRNELHEALKAIQTAGNGVLIYLRQEEKGENLVNEIQSYALQNGGAETTKNDAPINSSSDLRIYGIGAQMLRELGVHKIHLLTNHPKKIVGLHGYGITVLDQIHL
jgi:3,4-dihydroxy 2-butanone 4-phosphate synthase/GTP cyclohydrolase II